MAGHGASSGDAAAEEEGGDAVATDRRVRCVEPQRAEAAAGQAQCEEGDGAVCHAGARNKADLLQIVAGHERAQVFHHQSVRVHEKQGVSQLRLLLLLVVLPLLHVCG